MQDISGILETICGSKAFFLLVHQQKRITECRTWLMSCNFLDKKHTESLKQCWHLRTIRESLKKEIRLLTMLDIVSIALKRKRSFPQSPNEVKQGCWTSATSWKLPAWDFLLATGPPTDTNRKMSGVSIASLTCLQRANVQRETAIKNQGCQTHVQHPWLVAWRKVSSYTVQDHKRMSDISHSYQDLLVSISPVRKAPSLLMPQDRIKNSRPSYSIAIIWQSSRCLDYTDWRQTSRRRTSLTSSNNTDQN